MKLLLSIYLVPSSASESKPVDPNSLAGASALVQSALRNSIETAHDMVENQVAVAATKLKIWAHLRIESGVTGQELSVCQKMAANPLGVAQQLAHSMIRARLDRSAKRPISPDILLDQWFESSMSSYLANPGAELYVEPQLPNIGQFLASGSDMNYIKEGPMSALMVAGLTQIRVVGAPNPVQVKGLVLTGLYAEGRQTNTQYDRSVTSTGNLRKFLDLLTKQAVANNFEAAFIRTPAENNFINTVLDRYGWQPASQIGQVSTGRAKFFN